MFGRIFLGSTLALILVSPGFAGPCTERLAELEKSVTAAQEGAGPAITGATPTTTGTPAVANQNMQMIQQAKQLDAQGKEAECMDMVKKISTTAPPATK